MSPLDDLRADRIAARFGRTVASTWSSRLNPGGGSTSDADLASGSPQTRLPAGRLTHDDDCVQVLAHSAFIDGGEGLRPRGSIDPPALARGQATLHLPHRTNNARQ